jgi:hypothetical protein
VPKPPRRSASRPAASGRSAGAVNQPPGALGFGTRPVRPKRLVRAPVRQSFLERNRGRLLWAAAAVVVVAIGGLLYLRATSPAYACGIEWTAPATPSPAPGATPRLGYAQQDMGRDHVGPGTFVKYLACPPASGNHINLAGQGPIDARLYGPDAQALPQGWIHNLEHGGLVLLYRCPGDACTDAGQAALQQFWASFPASPVCNVPPHLISPVIARFDDMAYPYAALLWDQVLPLQTLDTDQILAFFAQQGERTNPEKQCLAPSAAPSAAPSPSVAPAAS